MQPMIISKQTERRFILGRQGLWPGRRWTREDGLARALPCVEAIQLDPLNVIARSHDIALWGRVFDYRPEHLNRLLYEQRRGFDYGGGLFIYPMTELPYWRIHMQHRAQEPERAAYAAANAHLLDYLRQEITQRGPLGNRDFTGNARVNSYRGRKDTAVGLYHLWLTGELMIHHRRGFERMYDLQERIAPPDYLHSASLHEAETYFARKAVAFWGLIREQSWATTVGGYLQSRVPRPQAITWLGNLIEQQVLTRVRVENTSERWLALAEDVPILETLESGAIPLDWQTCHTTTDQEVVFLAPLDIVSARGRSARLFDFEYVWEVYKPAPQRKWGYYTLPILYQDRLVGRLDPKLQRTTATLILNGFWLEEDAMAHDPQFASALALGLLRFAQFVQARRLEIGAITQAALRTAIITTATPQLEVV